MLIEFSVNNFKSFKDTKKISMVRSKSKDPSLLDNTFSINNYNLLKSAVVYGANASGKSNLFNAMAFMKSFVIKSVKMQKVEKIPVETFMLHTETESSSSSFEVIFIIDNNEYRYGFEVDENKVYAEWLFSDRTGKREAQLFFREEGKYSINSRLFKEGKGLENKTRDNALFLSVVAQFNGDISTKIIKWFYYFNQLHGLKNDLYMDFTMRQLKLPEFKKEIVKMVNFADLGISDLEVIEKEVTKETLPENLPDEIREMMMKDNSKLINIITKHNKYNEKMELDSLIDFELNKNESDGTKKFFAISAPILDTLKNGKILVIDELDSSLHPVLTEHLIKLFNDKNINNKNAQLIFTTHNTNLLNNSIFRRDQIWFTEKDKFGATDLYSLIEYNKPRKNDLWEKRYLQGRYGGVPYIKNIKFNEES